MPSYTSKNCTSGSSAAGSGTVSTDGTTVGNSNSRAALAARGYSYHASYGGNTNRAPHSCPTRRSSDLQGSTATPTSVYDETSLQTVNNTTHAGLGDKTHDTSSVTGQIGSATRRETVTYSVYTSNDCTTGSSTAGSGTVSSDGSVGNSNTSAALAAGGYSYQASYGGNANYASSTGPCEKFTVDQGSTGTPTSVYDETSLQTVNNTTHAGLGDKTHDTSSVTG